jgi:hypothetical protein
MSTRDSRNLDQEVSRNTKRSALKLVEDLAKATGKHVSLQTIRNRLHESGYKGRAAKKRNPLSMNETGGKGWNSHAPK